MRLSTGLLLVVCIVGAMLFALAGCGAKDKFVGTWAPMDPTAGAQPGQTAFAAAFYLRPFIVEKTDGNYYFTGVGMSTKMPATLSGDQLSFSDDKSGIPPAKFTISSDGKLTVEATSSDGKSSVKLTCSKVENSK